MVVAAHRVAMVTLALRSSALTPTIRISIIPQPHLLLMSLSKLEHLYKCKICSVIVNNERFNLYFIYVYQFSKTSTVRVQYCVR